MIVRSSLQMGVAVVVALIPTGSTLVVSMLVTPLSGLIRRMERTTPSCAKSLSEPLALLSLTTVVALIVKFVLCGGRLLCSEEGSIRCQMEALEHTS